MDNKISNMDISKFDPTNASVDSVRKWLFAIIDAELDKAPDKRDYDLIKECSECEMELPVEDVGMSESDLIVGLERIKAHVTTGETKEKIQEISSCNRYISCRYFGSAAVCNCYGCFTGKISRGFYFGKYSEDI